MAFGGFGGFGQNNNNNNTTSGFGGTGGFGSTGSAFGNSNSTNTGFGANNATTGGSIFGGGSGGGFGASNTTSAFGQNKTGFGNTSTPGGSLFQTGNNTGSGFGGSSGFGSNNNNNTGGGFGASNSNTGGGMFGQKSSAFGTSSTGGGIFGGSNTNTNTSTSGGGFGASTQNTFGGGFSNGSNPPLQAAGESPGTGGTTFSAQTEKEPNSNVTNHFQSITFMNPYQKHSFEELRVVDYAKGQKHGNAGGQAGAFGQSTGFGSGGFGANNNNTTTGGFGNTNTGGGIFGNSAATTSSSGFGNNTATSGGFGTGNSLFGNKPAASGGMFNSTSNATSTGGGLFGNNGGFGANNQQQNQSGAGLFGGNNNTNNQAKPSLFGPTGATGGGFGGTANNTTGGGLFNNANNNQQQTGGGLFGGNQQQQQNTNPFGGATTNTTTTGFGSGFGTNNNNNQAKPGGLFGGATNTGGGIFGNNQNQQATGFGSTQPQQQTSLFQNSTQNQPATGGLFTNTNNQPKTGLFGGGASGATGGGLFGGAQQQQQQNSGGLFGNSQSNQTQNTGFGGSLFGNNQQNNQPSNSLFGNSQNAASSMLGNSQQQQQQNALQGPAGYTATLTDPSPYGSASIFNGLPPPPQNSPGPIATPINAGSVKARKPAALPQYKLNPAAASRLITPQKRGYGLSYSTYGTPSSVASTPGALSGGLLGGSLGRSLGKSFSTSNLRSQMESEPSVLGAGALTGSLRASGSGSLKRLTIDRSLRTDLFASQDQAALPASGFSAATSTDTSASDGRPSSRLKKSVSFETTGQSGSEKNGERTESQQLGPQEMGYQRSNRGANGRSSMPSQTETDRPKGNELVSVPEDEASSATSSRQPSEDLFGARSEPSPGRYWMQPPLEQLKKMTRSELKALEGFQVGRENTGFVHFDQPVDLTTVELDHIPEALVIITSRMITVYPENALKPSVGKGLNVPSTITLENCWPRGRDRVTRVAEKTGPRVTKHIERLKRVEGTEFVSYDVHSGKWSFKVPHFTTYGLDDEEDEEDVPAAAVRDSVMSDGLATPTPKGKQVRATPDSAREIPQSSSGLSSVNSDSMNVDFDDSRLGSYPDDDTFGFRKAKRFPGAFDDMPAFEDSEPEDDNVEMAVTQQDSWNDPASPASAQEEDEPTDVDNGIDETRVTRFDLPEEDLTMAGSFPGGEDDEFMSKLATPPKLIPELNDDWADRLQHTISPRKNDRQFLKQSQVLLDRGESLLDVNSPTKNKTFKANQIQSEEIKTGVDLMRSLFGKEEMRRSGNKEKKTAVQWPYDKRDSNDAHNDMSEEDIAFRQSFRATFTPNNRIVTREGGNEVLVYSITEEPKDYSAHNFYRLVQQAKVSAKNDVPAAVFEARPFDTDWGVRDSAHDQEVSAWKLLHILFDDYSDDISKAIPDSELVHFKHRVRKDRLAEFWAKLCEPRASRALDEATNHEEQALAHLSMNKVAEACDALMKGQNYRLATLVAQSGGDAIQRTEMQAQIQRWTDGNLISEMTDAVRAILSLLAGRTCLVEGRKGATEDKADSFVISERFGLDWKQAFGLRLWYGTLPEDSLETAVKQFADDLAQGREAKKPIPWFLESGSSTISDWRDPQPESRIDLLWSILVLVADQSSSAPTITLAEALSPESLVGNPMSFRLSFELHQMLSSRLPRAVDNAKADALTASFAASLEGYGQWQTALWALLFLSQPEQRRQALQSALARMAPRMTNDTEIHDVLFKSLKIPQSWIWDAKALEARASGNKVGEVTFLARAHKWVEAHRVLCEEVAPLAVIERAHAKLHAILENFPQRHIPEWRLGGQIFEDYLAVIGGKLGGPETRVVVENLVAAIVELKPRRGDKRKLNLMQNVALSEMARVATEKINDLDEQDADNRQRLELLNLPGNEEAKRLGLLELGIKHLKTIMATSS